MIQNTKRTIRRWLMFFMAALFISGLTAIPVETELKFLISRFPDGSIRNWMLEALNGIQQTSSKYPYLFYGYDWLAFAHFLFAILFIGPLKDPVRNKWVVEFALIACILVIPFALIAGSFRGIPLWWRFVDCLFGIIGLIPVSICLKKIKILGKEEKEEALRNSYYYSIA